MSLEIYNSKQALTATQKRARAVELRRAGWSYERIGTELSITRQRAHQLVTEALKDLNEKCAEEASSLRRLQAERLDVALNALWAKVVTGNTDAIYAMLRIEERRAKLLGLDAPTKIAPTDPTGEDEWGAAEAQLETKMRRLYEAADATKAEDAARLASEASGGLL